MCEIANHLRKMVYLKSYWLNSPDRDKYPATDKELIAQNRKDKDYQLWLTLYLIHKSECEVCNDE